MHAMSMQNEIQHACLAILGKEVSIQSIKTIGGGSISNSLGLRTNHGSFFLKMNNSKHAPVMFESELDGLEVLAKSSNFMIPKVFGSIELSGTSYLLMELIESGSRHNEFWDKLGKSLAGLHRNRAEQFGHYRSNFIGSLPQLNNYIDTWSEFFISQRLNPMLALARNEQLVDRSFVKRFDQAMPALVNEMPIEPASLIHGDLWSGNLMVDNAGNPTLIDPAVYYGHREMDLAFSHMFGGFSVEFYESYDNAYPLEPGFETRIAIYNLYPQLVHLNLFGMSYFESIDRTISRFT